MRRLQVDRDREKGGEMKGFLWRLGECGEAKTEDRDTGRQTETVRHRKMDRDRDRWNGDR